MSGVIDENGVQWEHCNVCGGWVNIDDLGYLRPDEDYKYGLDICGTCHDIYDANPEWIKHIRKTVQNTWEVAQERARAADRIKNIKFEKVEP